MVQAGQGDIEGDIDADLVLWLFQLDNVHKLDLLAFHTTIISASGL